MLYVNLTPQFRTGAVRSLRSLAPVAQSLRAKVFKGASTAMIGAVAGWGGVMLLGAVLMTGASHDTSPSLPTPGPALAAIVPPVVAAPLPAPAPAVVSREAAAAPAPAPTPTKVSQRVDMSTTAAIPDPAKSHHKPHPKKKPLDNAN